MVLRLRKRNNGATCDALEESENPDDVAKDGPRFCFMELCGF